MLPGGVIEHLDVIEQVLAPLGSGPIAFPTSAIALEHVEKALGYRIISKFEALRERMVFEGPELTFTTCGSPDPRLLHLVQILDRHVARESH